MVVSEVVLGGVLGFGQVGGGWCGRVVFLVGWMRICGGCRLL